MRPSVAQDTLGGAVGVASDLPAQLAATVLGVAQDAFVQGMQVAAAISGVLAVGVALFAVAVLRNVRTGGTESGAGGSGADSHLGGRGPRRTLLSLRSASRTNPETALQGRSGAGRRRSAASGGTLGVRVSNRSKEDSDHA